MSEKIELADFILTGDLYLSDEGRLIQASMDAPVAIRLPSKIMRKGELIDQPEHSHLKRVAPKPPVNAVMGHQPNSVPKSHKIGKVRRADKD